MIYFVSGHRDLTKKEFEEHYVPLIQKVMTEDSLAEFVVGDWEGCDEMFLTFIRCTSPKTWITIYCCNDSRIKTYGSIYIYNQFSTYDQCDISMTEDSDFDIAWIRPGREDSHTAKNIKRRYGLK